jgi:multidrug resistance efflux pump
VKVGFKRDVRNGQALQSAVDEAQENIDKLTAELESYTQRLEQAEKLVAASVANIEKLLSEVNMDEGDNATINLLKEKIRRSAVSVTNAGFVDKIYARPGDVLKVGDRIMDIVKQAPKTIEALIPEADALTLKQGDVVYIAIPKNQKVYVEATILSMQQSLSQIADNSTTIRGHMIRGRMVTFGNLGGNGEESAMPLLPGSEVMITLDPPGKIPFISWFTR